MCSATTSLQIPTLPGDASECLGTEPCPSDVQTPQNVPSHSPPWSPGGTSNFLGVSSTKTVPGAETWDLQGDDEHGKDLWTSPAPHSPPMCNWTFLIKSMDIPGAFPAPRAPSQPHFSSFPVIPGCQTNFLLLGRLANSLDITLSHPP